MGEYLVTFGNAGELGRFAAQGTHAYRRGERVVIRTASGLALGVVRCEASPLHARLLADQPAGDLLRIAGEEDEAIAHGIQERARRLFEDARRLAVELDLPLDVLDVDIQLDGHRVTLYFLRSDTCDERPLVSALSKKYEVLVAMKDLALPAGASSCGKPDCGNGNCTSCGTGGCSTGCGSKALSAEVKEYFAGLRQQMETQRRVPLY